jgi:protein-S-isoprenylcysteine O-methyltransferase Ste14
VASGILSEKEVGRLGKEKAMGVPANNGEHPYGDKGQLILFVLFLVVWVADSFFLSLSAAFTDHIPLYLRLVISAALLLLSICLVKSGHNAVGHEGTPKAVIDTGAFRFVRHPLYLGTLLFYLCLVASTASLLSFAMFVVICVFYDYISCYEERVLLEILGDEYRSYRDRTGMWIPKIAGVGRSAAGDHSNDETAKKQNEQYTSGT